MYTPLIFPSSLVAYLSVPPRYQFQRHRNPTAVKEQELYNPEVLRMVLELVFHPLKVLFDIDKAPGLCGWLDLSKVILSSVFRLLTTSKAIICTR
jgi:hypothetical protein